MLGTHQTAAAASAVPAVVAAPPATIAPAPAPVAPPPAVAPPMPPAPVTAPAVAAVETVLSSPDSPTAGHGLRIAGIACDAVGLASIGTAIYFYTRAPSLSDTITTSNSPSASDYLLSWNCKHIANAALRSRIEAICRLAGFEPPVICTPLELVEE